MSEIEWKQPQTAGEQNSGSRTPVVGSRARSYLETFALIAFLTIARKLLQLWIPGYLAFGLSVFLTGLLAYAIGRVGLGRYHFGKWALIVLLISAGLTLVVYVLTEVFRF